MSSVATSTRAPVARVPRYSGRGDHFGQEVLESPPALDLSSCNYEPLKLKKNRRSDDSDKKQLNLSSYDSDFLSGLFVDLREDSGIPGDSAVGLVPNNSKPELQASSTIKRRRISTGGSWMMTRLGPSSNSAMNIQLGSHSIIPVKTTTMHLDLPATISDSFPSHQYLLAAGSKSGVEDDGANTDKQDDFGWFVDLDDQQKAGAVVEETYEYANVSSSKYASLAYTAATAPNGPVNHVAELEWAQAADTVDDVLGDFF